jgi:hypothetical protein
MEVGGVANVGLAPVHAEGASRLWADSTSRIEGKQRDILKKKLEGEKERKRHTEREKHKKRLRLQADLCLSRNGISLVEETT